MTSRELTSGFDFWSRGHLRMAVMHLSIKFGADIFIQCGVIDIVPKFKMAIKIQNFGLGLGLVISGLGLGTLWPRLPASASKFNSI